MSDRLIEAAGAPLARIAGASGPIVAVALHAGHALRPGLERWITLDESDRLREEDPFTASMAPRQVTLIEVVRSRFEVDLNRPRHRCVYEDSNDAWGLPLYDVALPAQQRRVSLDVYDAFYSELERVLRDVVSRHGRFVVLDLHSYNHRRAGAHAPAAQAQGNPEVNLGTRRIDRNRWAPVVETFADTMRDDGFDCRENVKFGGGHLAQWVCDTFDVVGVPLAIEFKKTYMDEWTGAADVAAVGRIRQALERSVPRIREALDKVPVEET